MSNSANCQACGQEHFDFQLTKVKIASFSHILNICESCYNTDPVSDYKAAYSGSLIDPRASFQRAARIIQKLAQEASEAEISGPQVRIEPMESLIDEAVKRLKQIDPNYFVGVSKIISGQEANYGHISSDNVDVIHVNYPRIKAEVTQKMSGASQEDINEEIIKQLVGTIGHEKGHNKDFNPETNQFPGGEGAAHIEEQKINQQVK